MSSDSAIRVGKEAMEEREPAADPPIQPKRHLLAEPPKALPFTPSVPPRADAVMLPPAASRRPAGPPPATPFRRSEVHYVSCDPCVVTMPAGPPSSRDRSRSPMRRRGSVITDRDFAERIAMVMAKALHSMSQFVARLDVVAVQQSPGWHWSREQGWYWHDSDNWYEGNNGNDWSSSSSS